MLQSQRTSKVCQGKCEILIAPDFRRKIPPAKRDLPLLETPSPKPKMNLGRGIDSSTREGVSTTDINEENCKACVPPSLGRRYFIGLPDILQNFRIGR